MPFQLPHEQFSAEYMRNLAITREFAAIGNNLNQIAAFFNSGGIQSRAMHENINHAISCIFEMREQVAEMAGKNYGNLKAYRK